MKDAADTTISLGVVLKHLSYALAFFAGTAGLNAEAMATLALLMIADTITGMIRVAVIDGPNKLTSSRWWTGVISKGLIWMVPAILSWTGKGAGINFTPVATAMLSMLVLAEGYSVLGNIYSIHTRKEKREWDAVAFVIGAVRTFIERTLRDNIKNYDDKK